MEAIEYGISSINFKSLKEGQIKAVVGYLSVFHSKFASTVFAITAEIHARSLANFSICRQIHEF